MGIACGLLLRGPRSLCSGVDGECLLFCSCSSFSFSFFLDLNDVGLPRPCDAEPLQPQNSAGKAALVASLILCSLASPRSSWAPLVPLAFLKQLVPPLLPTPPGSSLPPHWRGTTALLSSLSGVRERGRSVRLFAAASGPLSTAAAVRRLLSRLLKARHSFAVDSKVSSAIALSPGLFQRLRRRVLETSRAEQPRHQLAPSACFPDRHLLHTGWEERILCL